MTRQFFEKIWNNGGMYDTKKYRYIVTGDNVAKRIEIAYLDTTAALDKSAWEEIKVK